MARAKGRDVVIDLMDAVAKLEATATRHADQLEALAAHAVATSAEMLGLSEQVRDVSRRMHDVSQRMEDVSQRVGSLEVEFQELAQGFVESAKLSRTIEQQLGRVARLLGEFAGSSTSRFDDIEGRLEKLERKAG